MASQWMLLVYPVAGYRSLLTLMTTLTKASFTALCHILGKHFVCEKKLQGIEFHESMNCGGVGNAC
jgi:hypothetical protein